MAEGLLKSLCDDKFESFSAGIIKTQVHPYAIQVLKEIGIDISEYISKTIDAFKNTQFDFVVTVCDNAKESCPFFPGKNIIHKNFRDPGLTQGSEK